jgi:hypothetical protein
MSGNGELLPLHGPHCSSNADLGGGTLSGLIPAKCSLDLPLGRPALSRNRTDRHPASPLSHFVTPDLIRGPAILSAANRKAQAAPPPRSQPNPPKLSPHSHAPYKKHPIPALPTHSRCPTPPQPAYRSPVFEMSNRLPRRLRAPAYARAYTVNFGQKPRFSAPLPNRSRFRVTESVLFCRCAASRLFGVFRPRQSVKGICPS